MIQTRMGIFNIRFFVVLIISILSVGVGLLVIFGELFIEEMVAGWSIAFFNQTVHWLIRQYNWQKKSKQFFMRSLGLNGLRAGIFFLTIIGFLVITDLKTAPFVYSLFGAYFIFLIYNILNMQSTSLRAYGSDL